MALNMGKPSRYYSVDTVHYYLKMNKIFSNKLLFTV